MYNCSLEDYFLINTGYIQCPFFNVLEAMVFDPLDSNLHIFSLFFFTFKILSPFLHLQKCCLWFKRLLKLHLLHEVFSDHSIWNNLLSFSVTFVVCDIHLKCTTFCLCKFPFGYCMSSLIHCILQKELVNCFLSQNCVLHIRSSPPFSNSKDS